MILNNLIFLFIISFLFSNIDIHSMSIVSLFENFDDADSIVVFDIGRPSLNSDSEWISFEKNFNYKTEKYDIFFSREFSNNQKNHIKFHKSAGKRKKKYYAENIMWPKYIDDPDVPSFYFFHNKTKINAWSFEVAGISDDVFDIYKIYPTSSQRALGDLKMDFMSVPDSWGDELYYLIATSNNAGSPRKFIIASPDAYVSYNPDNFAIFDSNDLQYNRDLYSPINQNDLLRNPSEIQTKDFNDLGFSQVVVNFKSQVKAQQYDLYYYCDIIEESFSEDHGYQVFPRNDEYIEDGIYHPFCNQFEPQFNFNGSKVAFLGQRVNTNEKTKYSEPCQSDKDIDLWVFDLSDYFERVCQESYTPKSDNSSFGDDYYKIDSNIRNLFRFEQETNSKLSLARDYAWHPSRDILFYINEKTNDRGEIYWPISYYNFEKCSSDDYSNCENGILQTHTLDNRHITVSQDGDFLLFSFSKVDHKTSSVDSGNSNLINIPTVENGKCHNCHMYNKWKVAVAKIQIDDE